MCSSMSYWLIGFCTTLVTCVCGHHHHWFYFSAPSHYATYCHQLANVFCLDISYWKWFVEAHVLEVYFTAITKAISYAKMNNML